TVIFDLTRNQDVTPLAGRPVKNRLTLLIFADASLDDQPAEIGSASKHPLIEPSVLQELLELARLRRIKMGAETVNSDRKRRNAISTESSRTEKSILHFNQRVLLAVELRDCARRCFGAPDRDRSAALDLASIAEKRERAGTAPQQRCDMVLLPEGEAHPTGNVTVRINQLSPEAAKLDRL